ncbi:hypothetical protein RHGRI_035172 [Rhododendron griersonianum]|uniref:Uncharacterized protein n=1 Tax=Rhododendron griersonianum TaxID=479676 RepID=A0AAV6I679_9ERIC|nr:hypothetical protein RHGRI_035172 [Rhododendron griersonianum]
MTNGGTSLTTFPLPAVNIRRPEFRHASTSADADTSSSTPIIRPVPRTSLTCEFPPSFCIKISLKYFPFLETLAKNSGLEILSRTAMAAAQMRGPPAKVLPWSPYFMAEATFSVSNTAPMGRPPARGLARVILGNRIVDIADVGKHIRLLRNSPHPIRIAVP